RGFDKALFAHVRSATSNILRAFWHNLTQGVVASTPEAGAISGMYRGLHVAAVTFAAVADLVMGTLGGEMKRRESLSARLGDVLSELYIMSCVLKRFENDGAPASDLPLVEWNYRNALYTTQTRLDEVLKNLPARPVAWLLRLAAFPLGRHRRPPSDKLDHRVASLILSPSETRERLTKGIYITHSPADATGRMEVAFAAAVERDRIEEKIRQQRPGKKALQDLPALVRENVITQGEADSLMTSNAIVREAIDVDDFAPSELTRLQSAPIHSAAAE
ncbi:MAG TPA: DUF1974 domain-containing protein, partial [Candidatus Cybelea sp.]|nr:DUF1974 domain-containing protein [Candidatus Cybelea sp.]